MEARVVGFKISDKKKIIDRKSITNDKGDVDYGLLADKINQLAGKISEEAKLLRRL